MGGDVFTNFRCGRPIAVLKEVKMLRRISSSFIYIFTLSLVFTPVYAADLQEEHQGLRWMPGEVIIRTKSQGKWGGLGSLNKGTFEHSYRP